MKTPLPIWVKPHMNLSSQQRVAPPHVEDQKSPAVHPLAGGPHQRDYQQAKAYGHACQDAMSLQAVPEEHPYVGRQPLQEQYQASREAHQPGQRAIETHPKGQAPPVPRDSELQLGASHPAASCVYTSRISPGRGNASKAEFPTMTARACPLYTDVQRPFSQHQAISHHRHDRLGIHIHRAYLEVLDA